VKEINILTSTDNNYVKHLFTQLRSIADNLTKKYDVNFWLFHYRIPKADIEELTAYSEFLGIKFHEVYVDDYEKYEMLNKGADNQFPIEVYFYFCAHRYLPETIERALYIDAGDIIFDGDIEEFYFSPFEGNFMIASIAISKRNELYNFDDLFDADCYRDIVREYINSGSLVLNLTLMRIFHIDLRFYENVIDLILENGVVYITGPNGELFYYTYDQGLLAAAFVGRIKFFDYEHFRLEKLHMPYNFRLYLIEHCKNQIKYSEDGTFPLPYTPRIIHFMRDKPWKTTVDTYRTFLPITRKYYDMFWKAESEARSWLREYRAGKSETI
jgi:lipopolysaccharide biosynthesis glycosyltransferase